MEMRTQWIQSSKILYETIISKQEQNQEQKLRNISSMVKEWKNGGNNEIYYKVSWRQIRKHGNFLIEYLSREKISDKVLFYQTLASLDSFLSIFKLNLFTELNFTKSFYRNIQGKFEELCLEYNFESGQKYQKQQEFQLYSILFLLVMLIYFSGRPQSSQFKSLPLEIVNKSFMNSLISLEINITEKNERIIGLILAYLVKNVNLKIYGEKMLKFILNHIEKIKMPRTVYHFVYCMRQINLEREIDIKVLRKHSLIQKLWRFWGETFEQRESIYLVDYINLILRKYPGLGNTLGSMEPLISKLQQYHVINEFSIIHQRLILQIVSKIYPIISQTMRLNILQTSFQACPTIDYALKFLSYILPRQHLHSIFDYIFPFADYFQSICHHKQLKIILFSLQILSSLIKKCVDNNLWGILQALRDKLGMTLEELKDYHVCRRDLAKIQACFCEITSIGYLTLS